jgi:branched-chain amino acid transport system permease protein
VGGGLGAAVVVFLREYLSTKVMWWQYVLGGVYILTILYLPGGLMAIPARLRQRRLQTGRQQDTMAVASTSIETQP